MKAASKSGFKLSPPQRRLWALRTTDEERTYRSQCLILVEGRAEVEALRDCVRCVVERHEVLRTTFEPLKSGEAVQIVSDADAAWSGDHDLSGLDGDLQSERVERFFEEAKRWPFNLKNGPVLHAAIITLSPVRHLLFVALPALCGDSASLRNLTREISRAYEVCTRGTDLSDDPVQYADMAEALNELLESDETREGREHWRRKGLTNTDVKLPFEQRALSNSIFEPEMISFAANGLQLAKVETLSAQLGIPASTLLLTCWEILISRSSGHTEMTIGAAANGRTYDAPGQALGLFAKYLPVHSVLDPSATFTAVARQVKESVFDNQEWQDYYSSEIVSRPSAEPSEPPFFQFCFDWENRTESYQSAGASFSLYKGYCCMDRWNIRLACVRTHEGLAVEAHFNSAIFSHRSMGELLEQYHALLESVLGNPKSPVGELEVLTEAQRRQLLSQPNAEAGGYSRGECMHRLFESEVSSKRDRIAVVLDDEQVSYGELNKRSNRLAAYLAELGVGPDVMVAISLDRSLEMVVAVLGVLKAGAAYVPLDVANPKDRLSFMLEDSKPRVIITEQRFLRLLPENAGTVVCLDRDRRLISERCDDDRPVGVCPENLAYVIYTSGSTGKPKGVLVTHSSVSRLFSSTDKWFQFGDTDVWTLFHSYAFDFSVWEIWGALAYGGKLVVVPYWVSRSPEAFLGLICREQVTVLNQTPSAFRRLVNADVETSDRSRLAVRLVVFGGEAVELHSLKPWADRYGDSRPKLINMYGITETTVHVTYRELTIDDMRHDAGSVIGAALPDLEVYLLDSKGKLVPSTQSGEIHVGGPGLARGYLNRADLTAERFVPDPFSKRPGARLYRSGDLAKQVRVGDLAYLGRIDHQVKIRGFRIELGEIESLLAQHPAVKENIVASFKEDSGESRLVAYVAPRAGQTISTSELRRFLTASLPDYMTPHAFVTLASLPLTSNGKVDRRALPSPHQARPELDSGYRAPENCVEERLATIWAEVLGVGRVGVHDDFFHLGGDSILSLQVTARAAKVGIQISPREIFKNPTIAALALIAAEKAIDDQHEPVAGGQVPLTAIQRYFLEKEHSEPHHYNQSVMLAVSGTLSPEVLEKALLEAIRHHEALRFRFVRSGDEFEQTAVQRCDVSPFHHVDLGSVPEDRQREAIEATAEQVQASLSLSEGPLMRVVFFDLGAGARLLIVIHHLVIDGVSWRILLEDLETAYEHMSNREPAALPSAGTSYRRWAQLVNRHARAEELKWELRYWLDREHSGIPFLTDLPVDPAWVDGRDTGVGTITVRLEEEETKALLRKVPAVYHTESNDVLLTALALSFRRWTGDGRLVVDLEGHGREEIFEGVDLSRTIGWFTTIYPVTLDVSGSSCATEALKEVKEQLRAIPNKGIGFGLLRYLSDDKSIIERLRGRGQPQVSFNYLGQIDQALAGSKLFAPATESTGSNRSAKAGLDHPLEIDASVSRGRLNLAWRYRESVLDAATVGTLAESFVEELRRIASQCSVAEARVCSPEDFPLARLDSATLDRLVAASGSNRIEDIYPLSPLQEGLLFHTLRSPESGVYSSCLTCTFKGEFDKAAFKRACQAMLDRHSVLRTGFFLGGAEPLQVVWRGVEVPWEEYDWRDAAAGERRRRIDDHIRAEQKRGFDLAKAPVSRMAVTRLSDDEHQFFWSHHHIVLDGWSVSVVLREALIYYAAFKEGRVPDLPPALPFSEYIKWLNGRERETEKGYWREFLKGFAVPTGIPPSGKATTAAGGGSVQAEEETCFSLEQTASLQSFARRNKLTLNTLVQGAWALLLNRYSGCDDALFGVVVAGRPAGMSGMESMVGLFINTLPLRVRANGDAPVVRWLAELQEQQIEKREYEHCPLVDVQQLSEVPAGQRLFDTFLTFMNYPVEEKAAWRMGSVEVNDLRLVESASYPINIVASARPLLKLVLKYDSRLYDAAVAASLLRQMSLLLNGFLEHSESKLNVLQESLDRLELQQQSVNREGFKQARRRMLESARQASLIKTGVS